MTEQKQKKPAPPKPKCGVAVPVDPEVVPHGWALCGGEAVTDAGSGSQFKFAHSTQYVRYLCQTHTDEGEPVSKPKKGGKKHDAVEAEGEQQAQEAGGSS